MRRERQFWHPPLDGSTTQSWAVGLALETKHVHFYSKETPAGTSMTSATSAVHRKGRGCLEWCCGFLEVRVCTQTCVSFTNRRQSVGISRTGALPAGAGLRHESSFHIWLLSSLCSVPVPVPEGSTSPISPPILGLPIYRGGYSFPHRHEIALSFGESAYWGEGKQKLINILSTHTNSLLCHHLSCWVYPINK